MKRLIAISFFASLLLMACDSKPKVIQAEPLAANVSANDLPSEVGNIEIYPNPNDGKFILDVDLKESSDLEIRIFDVVGKEVFSRTFDSVSKEKIDFELKNLATGVYYFEVKIEDLKWGKKLLVSH